MTPGFPDSLDGLTELTTNSLDPLMLALFGFSSGELLVLAIMTGGGFILLGVVAGFVYLLVKRK